MNEYQDSLKLLLSYNVDSGASQAYYEFVLGRYIPGVQALGLEMSEAWHTAYGNYPNRLVGFVARDAETMSELVRSQEWQSLNEELQEFVSDFTYKIIPFELGFQL